MSLTTRQQIINLIAQHGLSTTAEISRHIQLSQAAVRYQLDSLLKQGEIEVYQDRKPSPSRGHPPRRFRVAITRKPENLACLAEGLFALIKMNNLGLAPDQFFGQLAEKMTESQTLQNLSQTRRFKNTISYLTTHNYQPAWEARTLGPWVRFHNCPYAVIFPNHPDLCLLDQKLLAILTGGQVVQLAQIDREKPSHSFCLFSIAPPYL